MNDKHHRLNDEKEFSLGIGGPLYQVYLSTHLVRRPLGFFKRRIAIICLLAWVPLLIFSAWQGDLLHGVGIPFLYAVDIHAKLLISLALLIIADLTTHQRIQEIVTQFLQRDIITSRDQPAFQRIIISLMRARNSVIIEIILLIFVYTTGRWINAAVNATLASTWYAHTINNISNFTPAGYWYTYISLPLFQFLLVRWYFRMGIWYAFLWKIARLPLQLNSLHPDRAGGIGFLANSVYAFEPILLAHSVLLSGTLFNRILNMGQTLTSFKLETFSLLAFVILLPLIPLFFFLFTMIKAKRQGTLQYGALANRYVTDFWNKWVSGKSIENPKMLGTSDLQSLADLGNSFEVSSHMRVLPFTRNTIIALVVITAIPLLPLLLTCIPLDAMLSSAVKIIL